MRRALTPALVLTVALIVVGVAQGAVILGTPGPDRLNGTCARMSSTALAATTGSKGAAPTI